MNDPLLTAAMVGTAHSPAQPPQTGTPLDALLSALTPGDRERALLLAAGAASVYRAAGMIPATRSAPEPSPEDTLPVCSPQAARLLTDLFEGRHADLLPEALALLRRAGHRLPPHLLPRALDAKAPETRAALLPVLGERGRWLARHNPAWSWVADADLRATGTLPANAEAIWQEGTPAQRLAILTGVRETNPAMAREWLSASWRAEKADTRATLLGALETNLSSDDEAFLEAALDDKSDKVRSAAIPLLARLPDSAFAARMRVRADWLLDYQPSPLLAPQGDLAVTVPADADPLWRRDTNNRTLWSDTADSYRPFYVRHIVALVPPAHWSHRFGVTPAAIIACSEKAEYAEQLIDGLTRATLLHRDSHWAGALSAYWLAVDPPTRNRQSRHIETLHSLLSLLPAGEAQERLQPLFRQGFSLPIEPWSSIVANLPRPWSPDFSLACLVGLRDAQASTADTQFHHSFWFRSLDIVARSISPSCLSRSLDITDEMTDQVDDLSPAADWQVRVRNEALARFAATIRVRQRIRQVFAP